MFVQVTALRHWKSEHDESSCEDALFEDASQGIFAVADGVGTTLFSNIWAEILVKQFVQTPLIGDDPFETEWWIRLAQEEFQRQAPEIGKLAWNAQQKAQSQGSYSTLATLRTYQIDATCAHVEFLTFGDSCILQGKPATEEVLSFSLQKPSDFDQAPVCLPSLLRNFNRNFHRCQMKQAELYPGDKVILATDAVARWILSSGSGTLDTTWAAFQKILQQTVASWPAFIDECRSRNEMVDDDSTALLLSLSEEANEGKKLGIAPPHSTSLIAQRKQAFDDAMTQQNKELIAIYFGNGIDLSSAGVDLPPSHIEDARKVANALKEVMQAFRGALNSPDLPAKIGPIWLRNASLLRDEPCAQRLRQSLVQSGVSLTPTVTIKQREQNTPAAPLQEKPRPQEVEQKELRSIPQPVLTMPNTTQERMTQELQRYIEQNDDEQITLLWGPSLETYGPAQPYRERVELARKRVAALQQFRVALASENIEKIIKCYNPLLNGCTMIKPDEGKRLRDAVLLYFSACDFQTDYSHELQQLTLIRSFIQAYRDEDDQALLATYDEICASRSPHTWTFTPQERERLAYAQQQKTAREHFCALLHEGTAHQIVDAAKALADVFKSLTLHERQQLALAQDFVVAYNSDDDDALLHAYAQIEQSSFQNFFLTVTKREGQRINLARQRTMALQVLHTALKSGNMQLIVDAYVPILHQSKRLSESEHQHIRLARKLVDAYKTDNDEMIVTTHREIVHSPYQFSYTNEESQRINLAHQRLPHPPPVLVAQVNGQPISYELFKKAFYIKQLYVPYRIAALAKRKHTIRTSSIASMQAEIQSLKALTTHEQFALATINDLVNDLIIQQGISEEIKSSSKRTLFDLGNGTSEQFKEFKAFRGAQYQSILHNYHLTEQDVKDILQIFVRANLFDTYIQNKTHQTRFVWLELQKKALTITYPERKYGDEQTTNALLNRSWILQSLTKDHKGSEE